MIASVRTRGDVDGWRMTTIGAVCDQYGGEAQTGPFGSQLHASDYVPDGVPVVMPTDIAERQIHTARIARVSESKADELRRHKLQSGDIVFARRGDVGRFAVTTIREEGWLCGTGCLRVRLNAPQIDSGYLVHYLARTEMRRWLLDEAKGTTMPNLNTSILRGVPLLLPPLPEQRRIAAILDQAEALRAKRGEARRKLDQLKHSIFLDLFGDPVSKGKAWRHVRLQDVLCMPLRNGLSPSNAGVVNAKVLTLSAITGSRFDATASKVSTFQQTPPPDQSVTSADLLICRGNGNIGLVGKGYFPYQDAPDVTFPDTMIAARVDAQRMNKRFLEHLWNSAVTRIQIQSLARTTNGTFKVNQSMLESIVLISPPISLQEAFASDVERINRLKETHRHSAEKSDALFSSLQHRAFCGEL